MLSMLSSPLIEDVTYVVLDEVCVCVCARARERERVCVYVCARTRGGMWGSNCVYVSLCLWGGWGGSFGLGPKLRALTQTHTHTHRVRFRSAASRSACTSSSSPTSEVILFSDFESNPFMHNMHNMLTPPQVHERSIEIDMLLLLLSDVIARRAVMAATTTKPQTNAAAPQPLRLVLMSATADAQLYEEYMLRRLKSAVRAATAVPPSVGKLTIPGFTYPVRDLFLEDVFELTGFAVGRKSRCVCQCVTVLVRARVCVHACAHMDAHVCVTVWFDVGVVPRHCYKSLHHPTPHTLHAPSTRTPSQVRQEGGRRQRGGRGRLITIISAWARAPGGRLLQRADTAQVREERVQETCAGRSVCGGIALQQQLPKSSWSKLTATVTGYCTNQPTNRPTHPGGLQPGERG